MRRRSVTQIESQPSASARWARVVIASRSASAPRPCKEKPILTAPSIVATRRASVLCRTDALEDEPLGPLARVDFGRVDVALGVYRQIVHPVKLSGLPPVPPELAHDLAVVAQQGPDVIVLAVGVVEPGLRRVVRDVEIPDRAGAARGRRDYELLHERAVLPEELDAVVRALAHVAQRVRGQARGVDRVAKRLHARIAWRPAVGAPVPLVGAGLRVEDDHAVVLVAGGDEHLVRRRIDVHVRGPAEVRGVTVAAGLIRFADLQEELSLTRELEDLVVLRVVTAD